MTPDRRSHQVRRQGFQGKRRSKVSSSTVPSNTPSRSYSKKFHSKEPQNQNSFVVQDFVPIAVSQKNPNKNWTSSIRFLRAETSAELKWKTFYLSIKFCRASSAFGKAFFEIGNKRLLSCSNEPMNLFVAEFFALVVI